MSDFLQYLRDIKKEVERDLVFVAMPFDQQLNWRYERVVVPATSNVHMRAQRADEIYTTATIMENILDLMQRAEIVLADVSGRNPNVLYELGMASAFGKKVVLISTFSEDIPIDLRSFPHVILQNKSWEEQIHAIEKALNDVCAELPRERIRTTTQRLLEMCDKLGITDSNNADPHFLFRLMLKAKHTISAVGITGRSIFLTDITNLTKLREHLKEINVKVYLPHPNTSSSTYADYIEQSAPGAAAMQIRLSTERFKAFGFPVYWTRLPIPIGGVIVDDTYGIFQFFCPGQWATRYISITKRTGGMFDALQKVFDVYRDYSDLASSDPD